MVLKVVVAALLSGSSQNQSSIDLEQGLLDGVVYGDKTDSHPAYPILCCDEQRRKPRIVHQFATTAILAVNPLRLGLLTASRKAKLAELCGELRRPCSKMRSFIRFVRPT